MRRRQIVCKSQIFLEQLQAAADNRLTARIVPGGEHNEASWEKQNPYFISTLLYGWED